LRRLYCGISMAALLLALSFESSHAVRADDADAPAPSLQEMIVAPIMNNIQEIERRISGLEDSIGALADTFTSRRVVVHVLCVSDESGAQTCITKGQLDALLKTVAQTEASQPSDPAAGGVAQAEVAQPSDSAEISQPSNPASEANAQPPAESVEGITVTEPTPPAPTNVQGSILLPDQDPDYTGTVKTASSGVAVLLHPEIEISIEAGERSDDD
jgi:hypothetical protein